MKLTTLAGVHPSPPVIYTDAACREVDYEAYRDHIRFLLGHDIAGLCIGGHAGEVEALTLDERLKIIRVTLDETKGRIPVFGGVVADATHDAIRQTQIQKEHGVDAVLICPPNIMGWDAIKADPMLIAHFRAIDRACDLPFLIYGGPGDGSSYRQVPPTMTRIATDCENLIAWKLAVRGVATGENSFVDCVAALKEANAATGRSVAALIAGDANFFGALEVGAAGNVNACESVRVEDNTALYKAFVAGDIATAQAIHERGRPLSDIIYGIRIGRAFTYFHYRFKIASWMLGHIPNPMMRLPQVPPPAEEIMMIYDALIAVGKNPVRTPADFKPSADVI